MDGAKGIVSIRQILDNYDWLANWFFGLALAGGFSVLVSTIKDKLTFAAIITSFMTAILFNTAGYFIMAVYGYGGLVWTVIWALTCGGGGVVLLLTFVGVIRKFIEKDGKRIMENTLRGDGL